MMLDETQQLAVERCCNMGLTNRIVPITGAAGTGKTTIIRVVYNTLKGAGYNVVLCAPTGKAAKRIQEVTGIEAMTLHRLLEYPHPGERDEKTGKPLRSTDPKRNQNNSLDYQVIIADEYAMVNLEVHSNLIAAMPRGGRLLMFGDVQQLRPIETSVVAKSKHSPFEAALHRFEGVVLAHNHRQGAGSGVAENGISILRGRVPKQSDDFYIKVTDRPVDVLQDIVKRCKEEEGVDFRSIENQILSPTKKTWIGTYKLNNLLQVLLNENAGARASGLRLARNKWEERMPITLYVGDKVIWTENSYDLRDYYEQYEEVDDGLGGTYKKFIKDVPPNKVVMNGETGVVSAISDEGEVTIDLGDRTIDVPAGINVLDRRGNVVEIDPRKRIDLAYCITVHKAQGSEYSRVIYMLNKSTTFLQCRANFYTAITRAREHATVISDQRSLQLSVFNIIAPIERSRT